MKRIKGVIGLMRAMGLMGLTSLIGLIGLMGCSGEDEHRTSQTIDLMNYMPTFYEVEESAFTRADWWPSGYVDYSTIYGASGMFKDQENIKDRSIGVFFTKNGTEAPTVGLFRYVAGQWRSTFELMAGQYYLYGYIPAGGDIVTSAALSPPLNSDYANGAELTLNGLSTVTPNDVCVIVGAKNGTKTGNADPVPASSIQTGDFQVEIGGQGNYIFLLFDHIYSGIRFSFKVNGEYNALRTIKLKRLEMKGYKTEGLTTTAVKSKVNATITLTKNTNSSPITSVIIVPDETSSDVTTPIYDCGSGSPVVLSTDYSDFLGCFAPNMCDKFALTSTYDVYDTKGNLVRQNCTATNMIDIRDFFPYGLTRGTMYTVRLTVNPTYLYMLSEPDLDNPTIVVN